MFNRIMLCSVLFSGFIQSIDIFNAIEFNNKKQIQQWLKSDAEINQVNNQGQTALTAAVLVQNGTLVKQLLKRDVAVNAVDQFGRTALDYAVELGNKKIVKILLKHKARVTTESNVVKCRQMIQSVSGWRIFAAVVLGSALISFVIISGIILVVPCIISLVNGYIAPTIIGSLVVIGGIAGSVYGSIKLAEPSRVGIVRPVA